MNNMKKLRKIFALLIAMVMVLGMSTSVFAATITIEDAPTGAKYSVYKIFDATVNGDAVSYTIPARSTLTKATLDATGLFDVVANGGKTYVSVKEGAAESAVIDWLKANAATYGIEIVTGKTDAEVASTNFDAGYYYVKSSVNNGAVVMLGSATEAATIYEKNDEPGWGDGGKTADGVTYMVGDTITYTLDYQNALNYNNGEKVYQYVVTDTMPTGVELNVNSYTIKVNGTELTPATTGATGTYKIDSQSTGAFQITIPWAATQKPVTDSDTDDFYYSAPATIEVTYTAVLKSAAAEGSNAENTNHGYINPNTDKDDPGKTTDVFDGSITIKKISGDKEKTPLPGAVFVVKNETTGDADNGKYLKYDTAADDYSWVDTIAEATTYTSGQDGKVAISGLKAGSYRLVETQAPNGYNLLAESACPVVTLAKADDTTEGDTLVVTQPVENKAGATLPSTGGIGTTIFYIIGAILVIGAGVVLVTRRRMNAN